MNDKTIRYLAWGIGSLIVLACLFVSEGSFSINGLFTTNIKDTLVYSFLKSLASTAGSWAYFLWFVCLGGGVFVSWKYRFKTAELVTRVVKRIHEKA